MVAFRYLLSGGIMGRLGYRFERVPAGGGYAGREHIDKVAEFWSTMIDDVWLVDDVDNLFMSSHVISCLPLQPVRLFQSGLSIYDNFFKVKHAVDLKHGVVYNVLKRTVQGEVNGFFINGASLKVLSLTPEQYWVFCEALDDAVQVRLKSLGASSDSYGRMLMLNLAFFYSISNRFARSGVSEGDMFRTFINVNQ